MQAIPPLNSDGRGAVAFNLRAHLAQAVCQIDDLGFARRVLDHGRALGQSCRHQRVFSGANRYYREIDDAALQTTGRFSKDVAIAQIKLCAHRLECLQVQVDRARPNRTATGQRNDSMTVARQHRAKHQNRRAHLANDVVFRLVIRNVVARHCQNLTVLQRRHLGPQRLQQRRHCTDVGQARRVGQRQRLFRQERGRHQRQTRIFRPGNGDLPVQRAIACHNDRIHQLLSSLFSSSRGALSLRARACALRRAKFALSAAFSRASRSSAGFLGVPVLCSITRL